MLEYCKSSATQLAVIEKVHIMERRFAGFEKSQRKTCRVLQKELNMREEMIEALRKHEGHIEKHKLNVEVIFAAKMGIGEHMMFLHKEKEIKSYCRI